MREKVDTSRAAVDALFSVHAPPSSGRDYNWHLRCSTLMYALLAANESLAKDAERRYSGLMDKALELANSLAPMYTIERDHKNVPHAYWTMTPTEEEIHRVTRAVSQFALFIDRNPRTALAASASAKEANNG